MKHFESPFSLPPRWRWVTAPVMASSGIGIALAMWLQEQAIVTLECIGLAALPGLAALLYWFNYLVFKSQPDEGGH